MASSTLTSLSVNREDETILLNKKLSRKKVPPPIKTQSAWVCNHSFKNNNTLSRESTSLKKKNDKTKKSATTRPIFSVRNINSLSKWAENQKKLHEWCCDHSKKREHTIPLIVKKEKSQLLTERSNLSKNMSSMFENSNFKNKKCSTPNSANFSLISKRSLKSKSPVKKSNCITRFFRPLNQRLKQINLKRLSPVSKKPSKASQLNTIVEPFTVEVSKKDALIQTEAQLMMSINKAHFENQVKLINNQLASQDNPDDIFRSKSDSLILLNKNLFLNSIKEKLVKLRSEWSKTEVSSENLISKQVKSNSDIDYSSFLKLMRIKNRSFIRDIKPIKVIKRPKTFSSSSSFSMRPIYSRSMKSGQIKRYDIRRHTITGAYEAEKLDNLKEKALDTARKIEIVEDPFKKDATFTNNAIIQYLKSSSDSKFLCNEQLFVLNGNTGNTNNNNNENTTANLDQKLNRENEIQKQAELNSNFSDYIDSGKTKLGLQFDRLMRNYQKLSIQKKYLLFLITLLLLLLAFSIFTLVILYLKGPHMQHVYNHTIYKPIITSTMSTTRNTTLMTTTKRLSIVGESCIKTVGDCDKFMECKKYGTFWHNKSSCQCSDGYVVDPERHCKGLVNAFCEKNSDCARNLICDLTTKHCVCKPGYHSKEDRTCFGTYNSTCELDQDCLKNGECKSRNNTGLKYCQCNSKERTLYRPDYEPYRQCRLLVGAKCDEDEECIENSKCRKFCTCRETDLYFETKDYFCEDACKNIQPFSKNGTAIKYAHPFKCGYYFTCSPRDLETCPTRYSFNMLSQSCNKTELCSK